MYERFYQLREPPFALTPDPEFFYPSRVHREALGSLRQGVESHAGFVVITGETGSGKTTLLQALLNGLDSETDVARLVNTTLEPRELLEAIMFDLGLDASGMTKATMLRALGRFLVVERQANRSVLLVVDNAQNLGVAALEEIGTLSNLATGKPKLIQVVMAGQPSLRDTLLRPELEPLRRRITVSYHLEPLDAQETAAYINHRLRRTAIGTPIVFPRAATDRVYARSKGLPRLINVICDATLVVGYAEERPTINAALIDEALDQLDAAQTLRSRGQQTAERELAEQKRVLEEECRLLRERFCRADAFTANEPWPPVARPARIAATTLNGGDPSTPPGSSVDR